MASYPASVKTFTTKNASETIQPEHVNSLQDEVTAIEDGLLNGSAPLTSSNAAVAALSVSGGSTFASRPVTPPPSAVRVSLAAASDLGSSAASTVAWTTQDFITNSSMHSTGSNPERLTPQSTGVYRITAQLAFNANSSGTRSLGILDSSGGNIAQLRQLTAGATISYLNASGLKRFDALGGYVVIEAAQSGASTMSLAASLSWASMELL